MYDPKFRFTFVISTVVVVLAVLMVLWQYVFGERGLDWHVWSQGVIMVGASTLGGYTFVTLGAWLITFLQNRRTGFEATFVDETGTKFNFPVSLSKFLPDVIAPPFSTGLHPVEVELFGFLNGYREWPADVENPSISLYENAYRQWLAMSRLPGTTHLHRIASLSQHLGKIYAYSLRRTRHPLWMFWEPDTIRYEQRALYHGGLSAFVLSTMPSFRHLNVKPDANALERRALLIAIRYRDDPTHMPENCDPLAREIYESLHRAARKAEEVMHAQLRAFDPTPTEISAFTTEAVSYFQALIRELDINPSSFSASSDGIYLGGGLIIVRMNKLLQRYAPLLSPAVRNTFNLWELDNKPHPSWTHVLDILRGLKVLQTTWENVQSTDGLFSFTASDIELSGSVILNIDAKEFPDLRAHLDRFAKWQGLISPKQDPGAMLQDIKSKVAAVDRILEELQRTI